MKRNCLSFQGFVSKPIEAEFWTEEKQEESEEDRIKAENGSNPHHVSPE
jgi:hypothetical protein